MPASFVRRSWRVCPIVRGATAAVLPVWAPVAPAPDQASRSVGIRDGRTAVYGAALGPTRRSFVSLSSHFMALKRARSVASDHDSATRPTIPSGRSPARDSVCLQA
jgi:hypothetical protein